MLQTSTHTVQRDVLYNVQTHGKTDGFHISLRSEVEVYLRMASVFEKQERFEEAIAM